MTAGTPLPELEGGLADGLHPSLEAASPEVVVDTLCGIVCDVGRGRLLLVPRVPATFRASYKSQLPAKPVEHSDLDGAALLRSFFARGEAWRAVSDRVVQKA